LEPAKRYVSNGVGDVLLMNGSFRGKRIHTPDPLLAVVFPHGGRLTPMRGFEQARFDLYSIRRRTR
jgi:hypothetical protein